MSPEIENKIKALASKFMVGSGLLPGEKQFLHFSAELEGAYHKCAVCGIDPERFDKAWREEVERAKGSPLKAISPNEIAMDLIKEGRTK